MEFNSHILEHDVQEWLKEHEHDDVNRLILKGSPFEHVTAAELANQLLAKRKCKNKLPSWYSAKRIFYPPTLSVEQSSSEITAQYKANLVKGNTLIDITGGMGVDAYFFSKKIPQITHCELNNSLSKLTQHNLDILNAQNITCIYKDGIDVLNNLSKQVDWLYIDPARRDDKKGKVFLLEDCLPNILDLQDLYLKKCNNIMIKTSPMMDIAQGLKQLKQVTEIHVVAIKNEVKELLWVINPAVKNPKVLCITTNIQENEQHFEFIWSNKTNTNYSLTDVLTYIYEPNAAILKSGGTDLLTTEHLQKIHPFSHLFSSKELPEVDFPGKTFKVKKVFPYKKQELKILANKKINVATRNFKESPDQLKKKWKIKDGGNEQLFFTTNKENKPIVIWCEKVFI